RPRPQEGSCVRRPSRLRPHANVQRCGYWGGSYYATRNYLCLDRRERSSASTIGHLSAIPVWYALRRLETGSGMGSAARRPALRKNRRLVGAKVIFPKEH